jgi:putative flippase GtrA
MLSVRYEKLWGVESMSLTHRVLDARFLRFAAVGIVNTAFGYLVYALMLSIGLGYATASAVATVIGVLFNFKTTGVFVFRSHENRLILRFFGVYVVVYCANLTGLWLLDQSGVDPYTAGLITLLPAAVIAFLLNKNLVFKV